VVIKHNNGPFFETQPISLQYNSTEDVQTTRSVYSTSAHWCWPSETS